MSIFKRLPWISLALVLLSYSTLGWVLSEAQAPLFVWLVVVLAVLLLVGSLTAPLSLVTQYSVLLFRSNIRSFAVAVFAAFLFFLMLAWFRVFLDTLLIISAAILARIDFQGAKFSEGQAFLITSITSLTGVGLGAVIQTIFAQRIWW
ncbi:hypothetical protein I8751_25460 [Nostocaceae cyanobacterium CENA357]|uniref:Uncharacterized protein n=1 Tax=Atlanticothrix silvestris CENA357 TaxID=1725252 RepID=A0A8J7L6E3_9CYAN|nr:hypothetical protein [Atlanticothrix silvestris]MBH8555632.1 hypothetical protein [Atlanticothrix silvestris CENA357]